MNGGDGKSAFAFVADPQRCSRPQGLAEQGARRPRCVYRDVLPAAAYSGNTSARIHAPAALSARAGRSVATFKGMPHGIRERATAGHIRFDRRGASPRPQGPMPPRAPILTTHPQRIPGSPPSRVELVGTRVQRAGGGAFRC